MYEAIKLSNLVVVIRIYRKFSYLLLINVINYHFFNFSKLLNFFAIWRYLEDYEEVNEDGGVPDYLDNYGEELIESRLAGNPVHALRLFKRLTVDWRVIEAATSQKHWEGMKKYFYLLDLWLNLYANA